MFYDNFMKLCEEKGYSPSRVLTELGISRGSLGRWKDGGMPRNEYKKKIADYLGVSVQELVSGQKEEPCTNEDTELNEYLEELKSRSEMRMLFKLAKGATKEDVEQAVKIIEAIRNR